MPDAEPPHMTPDEFRRHGRRMVDWIADYMERVATLPVRPPVEPGEIAEKLPASPPERTGGDGVWEEIFADLDKVVLPGLTHWQHPGFFGYFPCNASGPAILGELASAGLNVNGMLWATSPAATELETRMLDWCADLFGLPDRFRSDAEGGRGGGAIQGTASESTLLALLAGRRRLQQAGAVEPEGRCRIIASEQAHSSVAKAALIAGLARDPDDQRHITLLPADNDGAMSNTALLDTLADTSAPPVAMIAATLGTTSVGGVDRIDRIADAVRIAAAQTVGPWLHVDAAFSGAALVCPEHRGMTDGLERADSICINPHKWLLTNFDCDLFWVADRTDLNEALRVTPAYLRNEASERGEVIDYRDWQIPLGRRFRALKLWFVLRHYGAEGLRAYIRQHIAWAERFERWISEDRRFELAAPRHLSLVCFRLAAGNDATSRLLDKVNASGRVLLSPTTVRDRQTQESRFMIRLAIGSPACRFEHVEEAWRTISAAADEIAPS